MYKIQMFPILEMLETTIICHWALIRFTESRQQHLLLSFSFACVRVCVRMCRGVWVCAHTPTTMHMWRSEDNL